MARTKGTTGSGKFATPIRECLQDAINKVSDNNSQIYSLRQLYYAVRPHLINKVSELKYSTFTTNITRIENDNEFDLSKMYRDESGTMLQPHGGEKVALGTLSVANYIRPDYLFNKVLFIEKESKIISLKQNGFDEKFDCALISTKGYSNRASKDLLDKLGENGEEIICYCVHDLDADGIFIYSSLKEATAARPERKIEVIDWGITYEEAEEMNLQE